MSALRDGALGYAGRGLRVFPCAARAKTPLTKHGLHDATLDVVQIERWWRTVPDANVAVRTGNGLVVLDADGDDGADSVHELERAHEPLPPTPRVKTGGGGAHYWLRADGAVPCSAGRLAPSLDVRGDGGYVLAPPSMHPSGRSYEWDCDGETPIAPAPAWLLALARGSQAKRVAAPVADAIPQGGRHSALLSVAGTMRRRGLTAAEMLPTLQAVSEARCRPPLPEAEIVALAADAERRWSPAAPLQARPPRPSMRVGEPAPDRALARVEWRSSS